MNKLDKLLKLFAKKKKASQVNFVPRETISVSINNNLYYVCVTCDENYQVKIILLDENYNIMQK